MLGTAIAPSFEQIGKLAAVAASRTALDHFVDRKIRQEREELEAAAAGDRRRPWGSASRGTTNTWIEARFRRTLCRWRTMHSPGPVHW